MEEFEHLPGEVKSYVEKDIFFITPNYGGENRARSGILVLSNYRLYFEGTEVLVDCPLGLISRVDKVGGQSSKKKHAYRIEVVLKDMRNLVFALNPENHGRRTMFSRLQTYAFPLNSKRKVFAFSNLEKFSSDGWRIYEPAVEYKRILGPEASEWEISDINGSFDFCSTYPSVLVIPNETLISRTVLKSVAAFRSRNRIPVLVWRKSSGATITRCAQPLTGMKNKRSSDDEFYLKTIIQTNPKCPRLAIMDARPRANAIANRTRNGGYESEDVYKMADVYFLNIHSIHVMRDSWSKLKSVVLSSVPLPPEEFTKQVESTAWLKHVRRILQGAWHIVDRIERDVSVLVHCSDGWDRTAQLTSVSQLLLDPYYRTVIGFEVLIEKEWISFGHKFQTRTGHGDHNYSDSDRSPVFLQFLDCVWQLTQQFPAAFEFNELFLIQIADHLFSCRFGTFLCNSELEREQQQVRDKTVSLWSYLNSETPERYVNSGFVEQETVLKPLAGHNVRLWEAYYCRWAPKEDSRFSQIRFSCGNSPDLSNVCL